jgi:hypothetical protein
MRNRANLQCIGMLFCIKTPADFAAVERHVATLLSSDDSRCALLRSEPFTRIKIHAIYRPEDPIVPPPCWGPQGLCVEFKNGVVSAEIKEFPHEEYDDSWAGPVVYNVCPGFTGPFDAIAKTQGPFFPGKRSREARPDSADEMV